VGQVMGGYAYMKIDTDAADDWQTRFAAVAGYKTMFALDGPSTGSGEARIDTGYGFNFGGVSGLNTYSVGTMYGVYITGVSVADTATYGVWIGDMTGATDNYAIYTGAGDVRFGDDVYILDDKYIYFGLETSPDVGIGWNNTDSTFEITSTDITFGDGTDTNIYVRFDISSRTDGAIYYAATGKFEWNVGIFSTTGKTQLGGYATASGSNSVAVGGYATASGTNGVCIAVDSSLGVGTTDASGDYSCVVGVNAGSGRTPATMQATSTGSMVVGIAEDGQTMQATATPSLAIGINAQATAAGAICIGDTLTNAVADSIAMGVTNKMIELHASEIGFFGVSPATQRTGYTTFSNLSTDRTCDADSTTVEELADILGTLIEDLKTLGLCAA